MSKFEEIQKYQSGGTFKMTAAPLPSTEELYTPQVNAKLYHTPYQKPKAEMPDLDLGKIQDSDALDVDKQKLIGRINKNKSQISYNLSKNPLYLKTREGQQRLAQIQNDLTYGVNKLENSYKNFHNAKDYMDKNTNQNSYAMTSNGNFYVVDSREGDVKEVTSNDFLADTQRYKRITNNELLSLRNSNQGMAGVDQPLNYVKNTLGEDTLKKSIFEILDRAGYSKSDGNNSRTKSNKEALKKSVTTAFYSLSPQERNTIKGKVIDQGLIDTSSDKSVEEQIDEEIYQYILRLADPMAEEENLKKSSGSGSDSSSSMNASDFRSTPIQDTTAGAGRTKRMKVGNQVYMVNMQDRPHIGLDNKTIVPYGNSDARLNSAEGEEYVVGQGKPTPEAIQQLEEKGLVKQAYTVSVPKKADGTPFVEYKTGSEEEKSLVLEHMTKKAQVESANTPEAKRIALEELTAFEKIYGIDPNAGSNTYVVSTIVVPDADVYFKDLEENGWSLAAKLGMGNDLQEEYEGDRFEDWYKNNYKFVQGTKDADEVNTDDLGAITLISEYSRASQNEINRSSGLNPRYQNFGSNVAEQNIQGGSRRGNPFSVDASYDIEQD